MSYLGLDIGTSGVRCVAFDEEGQTLSTSTADVELSVGSDGSAEVDADHVWAAVVQTIQKVASHESVSADPVAACSFSEQGEAVVPVDVDGNPVAPVPISLDLRGAPMTRRLESSLGADRIQRITGQPLHPMFSISKMMAIHADDQVSSSIRGWRTLGAFVAERLGVRATLDTTMAARTMAFDVDDRSWSTDILASAGIDAGLLPPVVDPGTPIGPIAECVSEMLGYRRPPLVVVGGHDQACAFWGAGNCDPGDVVASLGSTECVTTATAVRVETADSGIATYPAGSAWLMLAGIPTGGLALEWVRSLIDMPQFDVDTLLRDSEGPSSLLVLPYLGGGATIDNDPEASGAVLGLTLTTDSADLVRGLLEASGFEIRRVVDWLADRELPIPDVLPAVGGGAAPTSLQVRADASGLAFGLVGHDASARGAAMLAAVGAGGGSFTEVVRRMTVPAIERLARPRLHRDHYARQRADYEATVSALRALRDLRNERQTNPS